MKKNIFSFLLILFAVTGSAYAQTATIRGVVTDAETNEAVPQANAFVVEILRGDAADFNGNYEITGVPYGEYTFRVSSIGYVTYEEAITVNQSLLNINIALAPDLAQLGDVVVTGYASVQKRELTGSITSVRSQDIEGVRFQNTEGLLQGRAAGVTISTTSGNPGGAFKVNIRGNGSINASTEPLYIVDGVQISFSQLSGNTSTTPLNSINPSDIESIEVLKDAAASAIYGAQAAAGVVLITTKKGKAGRVQINANVERGVRSLARNVDYINSDQYVEYMAEGLAFRNGVKAIDGSFDMTPFRDTYKNFFLGFFGADPAGSGSTLTNTDWQDFIFDEGVSQKYNVSMSGGNAGTVYYVSAGYEDVEGTAFDSDFTRASLRTNVDQTIGEKWRTSIALNLAQSTQFGVCQDGNFINCPPSQAMFEAPMSFPFLADGSYNPNTRFGIANNPAVVRDEVDRNVTVGTVTGRINLNYNPTDWISVTALAGLDYRNTQDEQYRSPVAAPGQSGWLSYTNRNVFNYNMSLVANANQTFAEVHNVSVLLGTEFRNDQSESFSTRGDGFTGNFFNVLSATATPTSASGSNTEWKLLGYFTNVKYNYDEKYFVSFVGRYDGHSRFGAGNRYAFFPSISAAWRLSEESFLDYDFIDELKLRVGYGTTGNSAIGNFAARGLFSVSGSYRGASGITPSQLANANLGWEQASEFNIGLDFEFLQSRIYGSIDAYRKQNDKLLFGRPLPGDSGFGSITENIGKIENRGIEVELNSVNLAISDFTWETRFNVAFTENEILELPNGDDISPSSVLNSLQIGKPIGLIQVPRWAGVNPADGRPMWYDANGNITYTPNQDADAIEYNDGHANIVGGFGNTLNYKGFSLDAFFQFSFGQWAFGNTDYYFTRTPDFLMNMITDVEDRWKKPGDITYYPRAINAGTDYPETLNYRVTLGTQAINNTSYIRLKNVSLSYSVPTRFTDVLGIKGVRLYASGINLLTFSAWPWYDPEVASSVNDIYGNITVASYPTEKQVYGGIDIQF
jgi:TonB-linked SusC/RagA family outer membrane protein